MADEKKPEAKADAKSTPPAEKDHFVESVSFIVAVMIFMALINSLSIFVGQGGNSGNGGGGYFSGGFTPTAVLTSNTQPIGSSFPADCKLITVKTTDIYNSPGGRKIGEQA